MAFISFVITVNGGGASTVADPRFRATDGSIILPLRSAVRTMIDESSFFYWTQGTQYDLVLSDMAYIRSSEVDWSRSASISWFQYDPNRGEVLSVPSY